MKKMYPSSLYHLHSSIGRIREMNELFADDSYICDYLCGNIAIVDNNENSTSYQFINNLCSIMKEFMDSHFNMDLCRYCESATQFNENIIKSGVSSELDELISEQTKSKETFDLIREYFNVIMGEADTPLNAINRTKCGVSSMATLPINQLETHTLCANSNVHRCKSDIEYVKIHETDKSGSTLQITAKRSQALRKLLDQNEKKSDLVTLNNGQTFSSKNVKFVKASTASMEIEFPLLDGVCKQLLVLKEKINQKIAIVYADILVQFENLYLESLNMLAEYVSTLDVMQCKAYVARTFNYCCPILAESDSESGSFIEAEGLRHCLIEHIQQNEIYVTNDISLNESGDLLYGTNAVGKTSLIRAIGISIIMAQAGIFVPCSSFTYKPYTAIFSRILGNDNIFKGLSTFAVEMSELGIILKRADKNSIILGDELCSGTEMESALSIFVTGLMRLHDIRCSFIFATHFHEIVDYDEIKGLERLRLKHMSVRYDRELDCIIYDRKLKDGSGPRIYGLEVCKALHLEQDFLESAYAIRNKYYPESRGELSNTITAYNSKKVRGKCEMCKKEVGEEIHHMQQQRDADANGFIGSFHKNHPANLISVCKNCHDKFHRNEKHDSQKKQSPTIRKKTTNGSYVIV